MRLKLPSSFIAIYLAVTLMAQSAAYSETSALISIDRFTPAQLADWQLSGDAAIEKDNLRLTRAVNWLHGVALAKKPIPLSKDRSFSASFSFEMTDPVCDQGLGADGIAFVLQHNLTAPTAPGHGIGYAGPNSALAVEFDTYFNSGFLDPHPPHIGISLMGDPTSYDTALSPYVMNDGRTYHAWIDYDGTTNSLEVRLGDSDERPALPVLKSDISLSGILQPQVYVGFSAGTGCCSEQHLIKSFVFHNAKVDTSLSKQKEVLVSK